ncbi:MAG: hypothetical protein KC609_13385 [Myxococcales bacterium]|nr:hypothetical protein [Myxococcales bacterium]
MQLRTFTLIERLEPQLASFISTVSQGFFPLAGESALFVEVAPGMSINMVTDTVLKTAKVVPGLMIVERSYGLLEVHSTDRDEVEKAGRAILDFYGLTVDDKLKPRLMTNDVIHDIRGYQAMLVNRIRHGQLMLEHQTLNIVEVHPAGYAATAANVAERAANVRLLEMVSFGAFGRLFLGGSSGELEKAAEAIAAHLDSFTGYREEERHL